MARTSSQIAERSGRYARSSFPGAGALQNIAGVVKVVFQRSGQIGVAWARTGDRFLLVLGAVGVFDGQRFGPVLPILVLEQDGDGRADGARVPHAGDDLRAVGLDLHATAP